ncbi:MAG: NUDIX domain-containing protein [Candidatus Pacearchaeota archaeon]
MKTKYMKSAGGVVFYIIGGKIRYLLLRHKKTGSHWGFPKGRVEVNETEKQTALREIREETGINNLKALNSFREIERYSFFKNNIKIKKKVIYFLVEVDSLNVTLSEEHLESCWEEFSEAIEKLKDKETKEVLIKANEELRWKIK